MNTFVALSFAYLLQKEVYKRIVKLLDTKIPKLLMPHVHAR